MRWEVYITGPQPVLGELAHAFKDGAPIVAKEDNQFLLRSPSFENLADVGEVRMEAERIIAALSGISRILLQSDAQLKVASVVEVKTSGSRNIFVQLEPAVLKITGGLTSIVVTRGDGRVEEYRPSDPAPKWLTKALSDPAAARALRLRDARSLSWTDLYRLYEVIEEGMGGEDVILEKTWASRSELRRFKHSANSVSAAGDEARHGVEPTQPPARAMTLPEACSLVDGLLQRWLENE